VVRFAVDASGLSAFLADLRSAPPAAAISSLTWLLPSVIGLGFRLTGTAALAAAADSGLQLFIPATRSSLQMFILAGQAVTESPGQGDACLVAWL
jgi:hypothetical protein